MFARILLAGALACAPQPQQAPQAAQARLNLLLITADDVSGSSYGWMGDPHGATPSLDALAAASQRFVNCHLTASICQPSRAALMTGRVPHRNGALGFEPIAAGVPTLPALLAQQGYYTAVVNKRTHMQPAAAFGWDAQLNGAGRRPELWGAQLETVLAAAAAAGKPFFLNANIADPHRPFPGAAGAAESPEAGEDGEEEGLTASAPRRTYSAAEVRVPVFLEDLLDVRTELAQYYTAVARMDDGLKAILTALEAGGHADDTLLVFLGDNGMSFPFSKATVYHSGTHAPVLLRIPGGAPATHAEFLSSVDLLPTLLELLGVPAPGGLDGRSWGPLLRGEELPGSDHVVTHVNTVHAAFGQAFPQRCVRDAHSSLLFHAWSDGKRRYVSEALSGLSCRALLAAAAGDERLAARAQQLLFGAPLMFFDLDEDPGERKNLLDDPTRRSEIGRQAARLLAHMERTADPQLAAFRAAWAAFEAQAR